MDAKVETKNYLKVTVHTILWKYLIYLGHFIGLVISSDTCEFQTLKPVIDISTQVMRSAAGARKLCTWTPRSFCILMQFKVLPLTVCFTQTFDLPNWITSHPYSVTDLNPTVSFGRLPHHAQFHQFWCYLQTC